jgi:multidrug resistance efflux pump
MKRWIVVTAVIVVVVGAAATFGVRRLRGAERATTPTARVQRGNISLDVAVNGEVRTLKTATLVAPPVAGGSLQLITFQQTGSAVKAGDLVCEFDPTEQEYNVEQSRFELQQAEQEIAKLKADTAVQQSQDEVSLLQARFALRRAELDVKGNELLGAIAAQKNEIALEESRRTLAQVEQDVKSHAASNKASLSGLEERRAKAMMSMMVAQKNIESMKMRAPIDGLVVARQNQDASGGFYYTGMVLPEYRAGDMVNPGRTLMDIVDLSGLEVQGKINETDRAMLQAGQAVRVRADALPQDTLSGKLKAIGGLAGRRFLFDTVARRQFDTTFQLDRVDGRLRPGMSATVNIIGQLLQNVLYVPRQAVFEKEGRPIVYVKEGDRLALRAIKVRFRTTSHAVVEGLNEGMEVALVNPEAPAGRGAPSSTSPAGGGGGAVRMVVTQ